jgi:hypothetical protein
MGASARRRAVTGPSPAFPPQDLPAFLELCAGRWMGLRSSLSAAAAAEGDDDAWHASDRGELEVTLLAPEGAGSLGGLAVSAPQGGERRLGFRDDGSLHDGSTTVGQWQLWPDGSLELVLGREGWELRERIWFTKPNLRLRSTVARSADGQPGPASFCSEIRRVSRPAAEAA